MMFIDWGMLLGLDWFDVSLVLKNVYVFVMIIHEYLMRPQEDKVYFLFSEPESLLAF